MTNVYVLGFGAYLAFSVADACIKSVGARLGVFEIALGMNAFAVAVILLMRPEGERWRDFWRTEQPLRVHARALCGLTSGLCSVYAFSTIPLVDVYALFFLAPFFVTVMSTLILGEQVGVRRWAAVALGFAGVLLAVRPGFRDLGPGHVAALVSAISTGTSIIVMRSMSPGVKRTSVLGTLFAYALVVNFAVLAVRGYDVPRSADWLMLLLGGVSIGIGQMALLAAIRNGKASQVAPAAYSQLGWALVIGAVVFGEFPDPVAILGMACIVVAGLVTVLRERVRVPNPPPHLSP